MPSWAMPGSCATAVCVCTRPGEGGTFPARTFVALPSDLPALKDASHAHHAASRAGRCRARPHIEIAACQSSNIKTVYDADVLAPLRIHVLFNMLTWDFGPRGVSLAVTNKKGEVHGTEDWLHVTFDEPSGV